MQLLDHCRSRNTIRFESGTAQSLRSTNRQDTEEAARALSGYFQSSVLRSCPYKQVACQFQRWEFEMRPKCGEPMGGPKFDLDACAQANSSFDDKESEKDYCGRSPEPRAFRGGCGTWTFKHRVLSGVVIIAFWSRYL